MVNTDDALSESPAPSASNKPPASANSARPAHKIDSHDLAVAIRNSLKLGGSLLITWSVALIVKLQIPAHLGPIRQGHYAFAESFATMFFSAIGLGVDRYIIKEVPVRPTHASDFVGGIFALQAVLSLLLFAAMAVTLWITGRSQEIQLTVAVFGATQFLMCINQNLATILQATANVGRLAVANIAAKVVWGAGLLLGLHFNVPLFALALPMLGAEALRACFLVPAARISADLRYRILTRETWAVIVASLPFFISAIAGGLSSNLAMSALEFIRRDEREVGWYAASQNLGSLAMLMYPVVSWVVMPMLSRANARSSGEMMLLLRRTIEALLVIIAPATTLISSGSDIFIKFAFGPKYAPATTGLSILSLVFLMYYVSIVLAAGLVILGRSWSVTIICSVAIVIMGASMLIFVPLGRYLFGEGGECAGAAMAVIANEAFVVVAMLTRFTEIPFDRRNVTVLIRCTAISAFVLMANHLLLRLGVVRLAIDMGLYAALALMLGVIRPSDVRRVIGVLRARRAETRSESARA
jgi:O-antigen/teichoic acid export membrane protein